MTSFTVELEPPAAPRLAALFALVHAAAAASPWLANCPPVLAAAAAFVALAGCWASLARVPGPHCRLRAVALDPGRCRARLGEGNAWTAAKLTGNSRAYAGWVALELSAGGRRMGWLLSRAELPPASFRRLKALIRLAC